MDITIGIQMIYLGTAAALTAWLARTLYAHGATFLEDVFPDNHRLAEAVNRLLVTGFTMGNLGYAATIFDSGDPSDAAEAIDGLIARFGVLLISLAAIHFVNLYVFYRIRRRATAPVLPPPVAPQVTLPAPTAPVGNPDAHAMWNPVP